MPLAYTGETADLHLMTQVPHAGLPKIGPFDPFFHLTLGGEFNACIGRQATVENYLDGYIEAAQELASAVIDKRLFGKRDTLAMPILFNARHGVELSLKFAIEQLHELGRLGESHRANHDIEGQWKQLSEGTVGDEVVRQTVESLEPFVASLSAIDGDGQELRYAVNRDGERSMEGYTLVDLELVKESLDELAKLLSTLKYRVIDLHEEKASGTWTRECSRSDLVAIAKLLPQRSEWRTEAFGKVKAAVRVRFGLSSNKFAAAVNAIEASRECRGHIGLETPLTYLTDEHAMLVVEAWCARHPPRNEAENGSLGYVRRLQKRDLEANWERRKFAADLNVRLLNSLCPEEIADLEAVFYIGREGWFPEFYETSLARTLREHAVQKDLTVALDRLLEKLNFVDGLQTGITRVGRPSLAERVGAFVAERLSVAKPE